MFRERICFVFLPLCRNLNPSILHSYSFYGPIIEYNLTVAIVINFSTDLIEWINFFENNKFGALNPNPDLFKTYVSGLLGSKRAPI